MKNITGAQGAFIARILIEAYQSKGQRILEAGYTGQKKDKLGHTRYYQNGRQVKNPNAKEKSAIHAAASTSLPAGQSPSHNDAATRVNALHADTPPEHVAALANDLMKMSVEDLTKMAKGPAEEPKAPEGPPRDKTNRAQMTPEERSAAETKITPDHGIFKTKKEAQDKLNTFVANINANPAMKGILAKFNINAEDSYEVVKSKRHGGKWGLQATQQHEIAYSANHGDPVSAEAVKKYGIKLPYQYQQQGDVFVFVPGTIAQGRAAQAADNSKAAAAAPAPKEEPAAPAKNTPPSPRQQMLNSVGSSGKADGKRALEKTGKLPHELTLNEFSAVVDPENAKWQNGQDPSKEHLAWVKAAMVHEPEKVPASVLQMYADKDASISNELQSRSDEAPTAAAATPATMGTDALALDALRLKANKKPHNAAHLTPDALLSLKAQNFVNDAGKLTDEGRAHLYMQKGKAVRKATGPVKPKAPTAPPAPEPEAPAATAAPAPASMSSDANALDALRLKSNKKTHNPAHINPEALTSLKAQGFIDEANKLTPAGRAHLYAEKLKGAPVPTGSAAATPAAPKPKWKRANRNKDSLISIVKRKGGINSKSLKTDYDYQADIIEGGLLHAVRKQGMGLDEMAQSLQVEGHIVVPEGVDPGDYLLERMKGRHHSALKDYDKELASDEEAYYKAKHEAQQGGHDERAIEGSRTSGTEIGVNEGGQRGSSTVDEWDNSGAGETGSGEKDATVSGDGYDSADTDDYDRNAGQDSPVDNSFNFGANADEPKADKPAPAATAAPTATLKKDPRDKTYEKLIKKGKPIHNASDDDNGIHEIDRKHITPELRRLLQSEQSLQRGWDGPPEETESFQLKDKSDVTGDPLDDGMILIDKRKKNLALKQRHLDTLHAAGKNTDSEADDKKAKANADVENAIMHHLKNNYDATGTELRRAGGHKEYDENDPTSNPVHAALDRLEKSGKIKKGSGGNPLYSKADEAPAPTADEAPAPAATSPPPDDAVARHMQRQAFTGVDAQGRQWQNGELVAAKDDGEVMPWSKLPEPLTQAVPKPPTPSQPATGEPLTFDRDTNTHNGIKLRRGDYLTGPDGQSYRLDRDQGNMLSIDKIKNGRVVDTLGVSTDPTSKDYFPLKHTGTNYYDQSAPAPAGKAEPEPEPEPKAKPTPEPAPAATAPDPDPVTEPSTPAAAAAEPQPNDTPRTVAARVSAAMAGDFENARASAVPNMGNDLKGSARHKAMAWSGLKDAEANGTAAAIVKRDELLKHDPSNLTSVLNSGNVLTVLTSHLTMQAFPSEVHSYEKYVSRPAEHISTPAQLRSQYYEAFTAIKKITEDGAAANTDPKEVIKLASKKVDELIDKFRGKGLGKVLGQNLSRDAKPGEMYHAELDRFNPVANSLTNTLKRLQGNERNSTSVLGRLEDFSKRLNNDINFGNAKGDKSQMGQIMDKATGIAADILEGKSFNQAFNTVEKKEKGFDYGSAYGDEIIRTGGKKINMNEQSTTSPGAKVFMDDMKVRGVQFGNSLPDQERVYHAEKSAEALSDLTDILGLPDEAAGLGGKLGLAIGARGRQNAKAHFEPWQADDKANPDGGGPVINLTRANGAGSLAHEWGHGLDHWAANNKTGGDKFLSDRRDGSPETIEAMKKVQEAMQSSGFNNRLREAANDEGLSYKELSYWNNNHEKFARTFERHVQNKLHEAGRENTYLTGLHKQGHPLWPTNDEMAHMAPHMDALIAAIAAEKFPGHAMPAPSPAAARAAATPAPVAKTKKPKYISFGTKPPPGGWKDSDRLPSDEFRKKYGSYGTGTDERGNEWVDGTFAGKEGTFKDWRNDDDEPTAAPAAAPTPAEPKADNPAHAAWIKRGSNPEENRSDAFQAVHGKRPTFEELHGGPGGLVEKLKGQTVKSMTNPSSTITDVTPAGYGPGEADTPPAAPAPGKFLRMRDLKDAHRLPPDDLVKKHGWSWTGTDDKGNQWHNGRFIGEEGTYKEAVIPTDPHAAKIKLVQAIIARRGIKPPQPKAQAKKIPEASEDADPRVKRIRELMDAYC